MHLPLPMALGLMNMFGVSLRHQLQGCISRFLKLGLQTQDLVGGGEVGWFPRCIFRAPGILKESTISVFRF